MKRSKKTGDVSLYQASEFWDEHDFTEFEDIKEVKGVRFALKKKKYIAVDMMLYKKIKQRAKRLRKTEDTLVREWLKEKVG
ncbi:MAG: CopG family antitoxin [Deltaproteobacteria bacterium]|nr:CopG family antitoxin [Deltaproteobacteria bacterium]